MASNSKLLNAAVALAATAYLDAKHGLGADRKLGGAFIAASLRCIVLPFIS